MIKNKVTKILISAGVVATVIGVSPVILSHAQTFNNEHTYNVDSSNSSIQKAVVNTTVQLSNGTANKYDMAVITGEKGNDYTIVTQYGVTGSIPKSDLTLVKSGEGNQLVKLNETEHVIHVTTVLNVRQQPDVHSGLLTTLKENTNIQVTGQEGEWFQVNVNGQTGYVYDDFVGQGTIGNVTPAQAVTNINNQQVYEAGKQAYKKALNNIKTVSNYTHNESNIQNENTSSKTNISNNTTRPYQTTITYSTPKPAYVNIANGYLNLRSGAGLENSVIGHLIKSEHVEVLAQNGNWYKVSVGNTTGWVYSKYINLGAINSTPIINPATSKPEANKPQAKPTVTNPEVKLTNHSDKSTTTSKPEQEQVTKTILEVQTLCNGKQIPNATYCILGTGSYEGQNFNSTNKELIKEFNSSDITGANLTIAPEGYTYDGVTTNTIVSVKDGVRTIKVIGHLKIDKSNEPTHVVNPNVKPEYKNPEVKPIVKPETKITQTVVTGKVMCDGKEIDGKGSIFCINGTGEFNGVNITGGQTQSYPVGTITGGELTNPPTGYNVIIGANKVETTVKGNTKYITIISQVTKVIKPEPIPVVKPVKPTDHTTVKPEHKTPESKSTPAVQMVNVTVKMVTQDGKVLSDKTYEVAKGNPIDLSYMPAIPNGDTITKITVNGINETHDVHGIYEGSTTMIYTVGNKDASTTPVVKPVVKPDHKTEPAHKEAKPVVKPVQEKGIVNIAMINQSGKLIGSTKEVSGVVGDMTNLSMPTVPAGYKVKSITDNGVTVSSLPATYKDGTQDVIIHVEATTAPVRVVVVCNGVAIDTVNHTMTVGEDLTGSLIPQGLNSHYTVKSIDVDGQNVGTSVSGKVQEGQNVITVNVAKKVSPEQEGMKINSQEFNQIFANTVCQEVNALRAQHGASALTETSLCNEAASYKSSDMVKTGLTHLCSNGKSLNEIYGQTSEGAGMSANLGGLVAQGPTGTAAYAKELAQKAVNLWMSSAAHEAALIGQGNLYQGASVHFYTNAEGTPCVWVVWTRAGVNMSQINFN